jgi:hypothetical protein
VSIAELNQRSQAAPRARPDPVPAGVSLGADMRHNRVVVWREDKAFITVHEDDHRTV